ncbi:MAG: TonB-dependent receptor [Bacteroidales bacterium]|nr:TonB-dependent receptor [Bacteroidales bacterium]
MFLLFAMFPLFVSAQQNNTLSGKITDAETGEDLIGVSIIAVDLTLGVASNAYGFYSLTLHAGEHLIRFSFVGYESIERIIDFSENSLLNIEIKPSITELDEVIVSAERDDNNIVAPELGIEKLNLKQIERIPVFFGEKDILKSIQLLPGVSNASEGSTGFNVRGGSIGQNLILLDEAPVYSSSHLMGFFSIFNSDAIKGATVYKGGIPARFGGRAASVLDVTMNNGNNKKFAASGGVGLVASRLALEAPLIKDRMSFILSARRTYADLAALAFLPDNIIDDNMKFYFYDLNAKLNITLNENNRLFLSGFFGKDLLELGSGIGTGWDNATGTIRWNHLFSNKLFSNTSLVYSKYDYGFIFGSNSLRLKSGIQDLSLKENASWFINPENTLKFGFELTWHSFSPGEITTDEIIDFKVVRGEKKGLESAIYIQNEQEFNSRFNANYGIRISGFFQSGPAWLFNYDDSGLPSDSSYYDKGEIASPYYGFEPRIILNYIINNKSSLKFSYNRMAQYLHLLSNTGAGLPTDVWMPSSNNIKALYVDHFSAGLFRNFHNNGIETSVEIYYKNISNASDFKDGADIIFNEHLESQILTGKGRSYGLELFVKKKYGRLQGWASYSLSRSENRIEGISNNNWYPVRHDKTHDVSLVTILNISKRFSASAVWIYTSGNAVTFPSGMYMLDNNPVPYYTERNGYRMPAYHRMDLSLTLKGKERKRFESAWDLSFYNLYNRHNAYMISFEESTSVPGATEAVKLSLFGIVPSLGYKFKF